MDVGCWMKDDGCWMKGKSINVKYIKKCRNGCGIFYAIDSFIKMNNPNPGNKK